MQFWIEIAALAVLIIVSAFFAASEVAFLSLSSLRLHSMLEKGVKGAERLENLRHNRRKVIIALLIGSNVANVGASALATELAVQAFGDAGLGIAIGIMSFLLLTFGDIMPKSFATTYSDSFALAAAPVIDCFYYVSYPLVVVFEAINKMVPGVYSRATGIEKFTEEEVRSAVKLSAKSKGISEKEKEMIENVLEFNDRTVRQVMTPRSKVVSMPGNMMIAAAHKKATDSIYLRFPVTSGRHVVGVISLKMIGSMFYLHPDKTVGEICLRPVKVRSTDSIGAAFAVLQNRGRNLAIVVDEGNRYCGIITLDDIFAEIVGEFKRRPQPPVQ